MTGLADSSLPVLLRGTHVAFSISSVSRGGRVLPAGIYRPGGGISRRGPEYTAEGCAARVLQMPPPSHPARPSASSLPFPTPVPSPSPPVITSRAAVTVSGSVRGRGWAGGRESRTLPPHTHRGMVAVLPFLVCRRSQRSSPVCGCLVNQVSLRNM